MRLMLSVAVLCSGGVAALPPVDDFTRYPDYEQVRISPTGEYLAVTTKMDDFEYLTVIELVRNQILYRTHFGKNWDIADFHWATAERILVQPAVRIPGRTDFSFPTGEIYGLNADGSDAAVLFGYGGSGGPAARAGRMKRTRAFAEILHMLPDQPRHVLIGTTPPGTSLRPGRAYRLNIGSGQLGLVANGRYPTSRFVPDRGGAFREPDLYRHAVGYVGVYDLEMALSKGVIPRLLRGLNYLKAAVGEDPIELRARSPAHNAERIEAAVMLVHGGQDQRVPLAQAKSMRTALRAAGRPVEVWHVESMEGHGFGQRENRREMYTEMLAFFDRHIGPDVDAVRDERR